MKRQPIRGMAFRAALFASAALLTAASPALAQAPAAALAREAPAQETAIGEVVVTASRLSVSGYQAPTPVTVVGIEKLQRDSHMDLSSVLQNLPAVGPSISTNSGAATQSTSSGTSGLALANLRNLGFGRTLTMYDGIRVAPAGDGGGVDLNLLPSALISRIDVVTGGASAAWGSDAVSGVVNIILNRNFNGFVANVEGASNEKGTRQSGKIDLSYGADLGDRAHLIVSGSYLHSPDLVIPTDTSWYNSQVLVENPAFTATNAEPRFIHADRAGMRTATRGGLVVGPAGSPLLGYQFLEGGRPARFDFGRISGLVTTGGTYANPVYEGEAHALTIPIENIQGFGHLSYEVTDTIKARFEFNYARSKMQNSAPSYARDVVILRDNPFIDPSLLPLLGAAPSFTIGTTNFNNVDIAAGDKATDHNIGGWGNKVTRELDRQVFSLEGKFRTWDWNIDLQRSEAYRFTDSNRNPIVANYNLAVDAVRVTPANVGASGLAIGSIVCRSRLTTPSNGCLPLNVLGAGVADPAAIAWVQGSGAYSKLWQTQHTASAAVRGEPFSTWAGPVAVAMGLDYRREEIKQTADQLSYDRAYSIGNFQPFNRSLNSKEAFGEINVPLIKDGFVQSLDFNAAGRLTDYSTSGRVETWKVGATSQINDDVRIRATLSRDIRAPSLLALYNPGSSQRQTVADPGRGGAATNIATFIRGNPNLVPEEAETFTAGIVLTPRFLPGLSASIDYYNIDITGAFATPNQGIILEECQRGNQLYCALVDRNAAGVLQSVTVAAVNAAFEKTAGWDFQVDYRVEALGGVVDFSAMGNYTTELAVRSFGATRKDLNSLRGGADGPLEFRATYSVNYKKDRLSAGFQVRHIGAAKINQLWTSKDVDDNSIPAMAYLDLRGSYVLDADNRFTAYLAIDNALNASPPLIPYRSTDAFSFFFAPTRTELYDFLGRQFRFGVRAQF